MKVMKDCGDLTRTVEDGVWEGEESEDEMDGSFTSICSSHIASRTDSK